MTGRMFPFVSATWNPAAGACPFDCYRGPDGKPGCWAQAMALRYGYEKYRGPGRLDEKALKKIPHPRGGVVFVQDMSDISVLRLDDADVIVSAVTDHPETRYLFLSKNPAWYIYLLNRGVEFPENAILGATVETNRDTGAVSKAPAPIKRLEALLSVKAEGYETFVSVEPVMEFDRDKFLPMLALLHPSFGVAVGYDNYGNRLPEPKLEKTRELVSSLRTRGITVYEKTLRPAWNES